MPCAESSKSKIPKLAARHGIDARGGLVEKNQLGLVQHGAAESQPLLPPAGKLRGQAIQIRAEAVELNDFVHALAQALVDRGRKCGRRK